MGLITEPLCEIVPVGGAQLCFNDGQLLILSRFICILLIINGSLLLDFDQRTCPSFPLVALRKLFMFLLDFCSRFSILQGRNYLSFGTLPFLQRVQAPFGKEFGWTVFVYVTLLRLPK